MPFDPDKVDPAHADIFHHGDDGRGLSDEEWDAQKSFLRELGTYPFDRKDDDNQDA